jgi:hypothetical protein
VKQRLPLLPVTIEVTPHAVLSNLSGMSSDRAPARDLPRVILRSTA